MREFEYYLRARLVKRTGENLAMAKALLKKADKRMEYLEPISGDDAAIQFEGIYEALRETAQALMQIHKFKPYSHEALIAFLGEKKYLDSYESSKFDRYRVLRNKSVYEAKSIAIETYEDALDFVNKTIPKIKAIFEKEIAAEHSEK